MVVVAFRSPNIYINCSANPPQLKNISVTKPYRKYYGRFLIGWVYRYRIVNNIITTGGVVAQQINSNCILRITIKKRNYL